MEIAPKRIPDRRRFERHLGVVLWLALFAVLLISVR